MGVKAVSRYEVRPHQGSSASLNGSSVSKSNPSILAKNTVVILAHNRDTHQVFVRVGLQYFSLRVYFHQNKAAALNKNRKVSYFNRSQDDMFSDISLDVEDGVLDNGDVEGDKVYKEFLSFSKEGDDIQSSYVLGANKTNKVGLSCLERIGAWYESSCVNPGVIGQSAYVVGDVIPVVANIHKLSSLIVDKPFDSLTGFKLTSGLSILTGSMRILGSCKKYLHANPFIDRDEIKLSLLAMLHGLVEITSGALVMTTRILFLIGHAIKDSVSKNLTLASSFLGSLYSVLMGAPLVYYVYRGTKVLNKVGASKDLSLALDLDKNQQESLRKSVYKTLGTAMIPNQDLDGNQTYDLVNTMIHHTHNDQRSISTEVEGLQEKKEVYITDSDRALIEQYVSQDFFYINKYENLIGSDLKQELRNHYELEVMRLKFVKDRNLCQDFDFSESQIHDLRKMGQNGTLGSKYDETLVYMKRKRRVKIALSFLCLCSSVLSVLSIYASAGLPLIAIVAASTILNCIIFCYDFSSLYENYMYKANRSKSLDMVGSLIVALATVAATVVGVIFTKDVGLKIVQGVLGVLMLGGQALLLYRMMNIKQEGHTDQRQLQGDLGHEFA